MSQNPNAESPVGPGSPAYDNQLPPELPGTLEVAQKVLASGSFADVLQGTWSRPGEPPMTVAIKRVKLPGHNVPEAQFQTRVKRETIIWRMVEHPNILRFIGYQMDSKGAPMLVSPWCQNGNLASYTKARPDLPRTDKVKLLCGAARGLTHLHTFSTPIVHGDIKPENIIIQDNLEAGLCDFGISKIVVAVGQRTGLTTSGDTLGTNGFQAAEILNGARATTASDVYAFGAVILAAMSGKAPFEGEPAVMALIAVTGGRTPARADHPRLPATDTLWSLFEACCSLKPEGRPDMPTVLSKLEAEM
ncbi:hypothetical protein FRC04_004876 [Tulasnella sp. 424]|nr:hypothetical protein FRC04_004876 [Tulasnella sp. 424]KAG8963496.1 hypothetical protein FRC05_004718 [Tulasnella sp. 425]